MRILVAICICFVFYIYQPTKTLAVNATAADIVSKYFHVNTNEVLSVLENKCNSCHLQKKKVVFTSDNYSAYYLAIEEQVFIKKKMPKGKDFKLTEAERLLLSNWIDSLKD